ncbi:MAG TPA: methyltransferase, partial [Pilimelia sp.]|nr:methyltransferase [Pilimelia sp.]
RRVAAWLDWFDAQKVEGVGFGVVTLRRGGHADPVVRIEDLRQQVQGPLGDHVADWFDRQDWLRVRDTGELLAARYRVADGVRLHQEATLGPDGWAVDRQVLTLPGGLRWAEEIDPLILALVSGCDGSVALRDQLAVLAVAHDVPEADLAEVAGPIAAHLVERGILTPAGLTAAGLTAAEG